MPMGSRLREISTTLSDVTVVTLYPSPLLST